MYAKVYGIGLCYNARFCNNFECIHHFHHILEVNNLNILSAHTDMPQFIKSNYYPITDIYIGKKSLCSPADGVILNYTVNVSSL